MSEARAFNVSLTEQAEGVVVRVTGEIDVVTAPVLQRHLDSAIASGRPAIVVDLSGTTFLDARGVGVLVAARKRVKGAGGRFVLRQPPALVRRVLEIAEQLDRMEVE